MHGLRHPNIVRALDLPPTNVEHFTDDDNSPFEDHINRIAEAKITLGCNPPTNDRFCPNDHVTRGQMAAFLKRAWGS
ncbi:MAG: S-layer homology domain-containing protein [Acidobacteria bacterium]|nr:S-layer homology domain-containing protein [Acidobacteriota bacterium]